MGGNYFKLGRLPRAKYLEIEAELRAYLDKRFGRELYRIPRYYGSKADFGDVDILLSRNAIGSGGLEALKQEIVTSLGIETYGSNGSSIFTAVFRDFQVDFFIVCHEVMESKSSYMDFNDLGNIIGRLFRPFNLKYGEKGLYYVYRRKDSHYKKEILISRDREKILGFAKLDYAAWVRGFDELEEMFEWILESPYFRSGSYLRPDSPVRRRKQRPTIIKFIEYLEENKVDRNFPTPIDCDADVTQIEAFFPGIELAQKVQIERQRELEANEISSKFNGNLVMEWVGLKGKALGKFIKDFCIEFSRENLLEMSAEDIKKEVQQRFERMQN